MLRPLLECHEMFSRPDGHGGTLIYCYYDGYTWLAAA
jgi:hypothetical protein